MNRISCLLLFVIVLISSCSQPKKLVYKNVENFSLRQGKVYMDLRLFNPNSYSLRLKHADVDVFLNGNKLGKMMVNDNVDVPGLDSFLLPVMLSVDIKNALPNMLQLALNNDVDIKLDGTIKAGRHGIFIRVPINYEGKQDIRSGIKF